MQKIQFTVLINTSKEKVWHTMLDDTTYRQWTNAFHPGSYYKGSWEQGAKILFIGPDPETGGESGMVSRIAQSRPFDFVSIEHLGIYLNGVEDTTSEEARKWSPAYENYTFSTVGDQTEVVVDMDVNDEYVDMFNSMWPPALQSLKELAEKG